MDKPLKRSKRDEAASFPAKTLDVDDEDQRDVNGDDIISNLPEAILCHILTKLPTKHAVGTSILSSKWKNIFSSIPRFSLDFDDSLLLNPEDSSNLDSLHRRNTNFINFTYRVLDVILPRVTQIRHLSLKCNHVYDDSHIISWISTALERNISSICLSLTISMEYPEVLLSTFSGCTTLKDLSLGKKLTLDVPDSFCLPCLKYLMLVEIEFEDVDSMINLFNGCPVLEDLTMCDCQVVLDYVINISIPSLKGLIFNSCYYDYDAYYYEITLNTPLLETLIFRDHASVRYHVGKFTNIRLSHIEVGRIEEQDYSIPLSRDIAEFVAACSTSEAILLSIDTIRGVRDSCKPIPKFSNLTWMQLHGFDKSGWELLPQLLECAPKLEILEITKGFHAEGCYANFESNLPENLPVCLSSQLKKIDLYSFSGEVDEVKLVAYFLRTAKVLDKMKINCDITCYKHLNLIENLLPLLPRVSKTCELFISKKKKEMAYF